MVELLKVKYECNKYIVNGKITDDDIDYFNSFEERTILILRNTKDLTSELISKIKNNNVVFSITGGLEKILESENNYNNLYRERTYLSYMGLATILYYFEKIESELDDKWNDIQKAMYVYGVLASNIEYVSEYSPENFIGKNVMPRSLNGILYNKLTCAGFALVFKEMMDRLGIECYFQNKKGSHDFNIIKLNDNFYGIDITWDNCYGKENQMCGFKNFGRNPEFYNDVYHRKGVFVSESLYEEINSGQRKREDWTQSYLDWEFDLDYSKLRDEKHPYFVPFADDILFDIKVFTDDEYMKNLSVIRDKLLKREKIAIHLDGSSEEVRKLFLPYDTIGFKKKEELEQFKKIKEDRFKSDIVKDYQIFKMFEYLKKYSLIDTKICDAFSVIIDCRKAFVLDFLSEFSVLNADGLYENYNKIINDEEVKDSDVNNDIISDINKYLKDLIDELIEQMELLINSYNLFKDSDEIYDKMVVVDIYSKINILLTGRDALLNLGYRTEELSRLYMICKEYFKPKKEIGTKDQDIEFLYDVFYDLDDIKKCIEDYEKRELSYEEFVDKFTNVDYMLKIFDKLEDYNLTKEEFQELFNTIIVKKQAKKGK